ncbi:hypothetical protein V6N12_016040 [Hibiscus sabdariffa]|uniref:Endonuclease/exonuclease/phosphatase domain-containing protein n=1 Tax=Hibiscus sabdariffa TaxID=183260 RepID=A0ABR1Z822_9ROSI
MALIAWNVRGLGNKETVRALKNVAFKFHPNIIFLSETKQKKRYLEAIRVMIKFDNSFYIEPSGTTGGLSLWWMNNSQIKFLRAEKNFIDREISINGEEEWYGTFIYGPPYKEEKKKF